MNRRLIPSSSTGGIEAARGGGPGSIGAPNNPLAIAEKILLIGGKIWKFINANKAETHIEATYADALPANVKGPEQLLGWHAPEVRLFHIVYRTCSTSRWSTSSIGSSTPTADLSPHVAGEVSAAISPTSRSSRVLTASFGAIDSTSREEHCGRSIWEHGPIQWPEFEVTGQMGRH